MIRVLLRFFSFLVHATLIIILILICFPNFVLFSSMKGLCTLQRMRNSTYT